MNIAVKVRLRETGATDEKEIPCFSYYGAGYHGRWENQARNGNQIQIVGLEGDEFWFRGSRKAHKTREEGKKAGCQECTEGSFCRRQISIRERRVIQHFPRPVEVFGELLGDPMPDTQGLPMAMPQMSPMDNLIESPPELAGAVVPLEAPTAAVVPLAPAAAVVLLTAGAGVAVCGTADRPGDRGPGAVAVRRLAHRYPGRSAELGDRPAAAGAGGTGRW